MHLCTNSVSGLSPFAGECDVETMGNVTVGKYDFNDEAFDNVSSDCIDFITKLLMKDHSERLTAQEALRHKWVKRKPQYYPNNQKSATSPVSTSFKAAFPDKVRRNFIWWFNFPISSLFIFIRNDGRKTCFHRRCCKRIQVGRLSTWIGNKLFLLA